MDERFVQLKTVLTLYLQGTHEDVRDLDRSKQRVIDYHASYGPTSALASQALGMFYFMIGQNSKSIDKLDSGFKSYIKFLEGKVDEKGIIIDDEAKRYKSNLEDHLREIEKARKTLEEREGQIQGMAEAEEKDVLNAVALKFTEQTNYILRLNNVLSLYADYVDYLEEKLGIKEGFLEDDMVSNLLKDIFLGLEQQFEFDVERVCPKCSQKISVSPQSPKLICPYCGAHIGL